MPAAWDFPRSAFLALRTLALAYVILCLLIYLFHTRLVYFPTIQHIASPSAAGLVHERLRIPTADGTLLDAWLIKAPDERGVVLYCHGNGGNISHRLDPAILLQRLGLSTLLFDYRGYGASPGSPSEQRTYEDTEAAWNYLTQTRGVDAARIIIWGESLGGGPASWLAAEVEPARRAAGLVLHSTFTSVPDVGQQRYRIFPARLLLPTRYPVREHLARIRMPALILHSPEDEVIPYSHGETLFAAASRPKQFVRMHGGHNTALLDSQDLVAQALHTFLAGRLPAGTAAGLAPPANPEAASAR